MTTISVTYCPHSPRMRQIEKEYIRHCTRQTLARFAVPVALAVFFVVLFGVSSWIRKGGGSAEWMLPVIAYFLVHDLIRKLSQRQQARARDAAPVRNRSSVTIQLGDEGISVDGASFWWPEITKVLRVGNATILEFYPFQALAIPDEFLPADTKHEALLQMIDQWRSA